MKGNMFYIAVTCMAFLALTALFTLFPRSAFSSLERRELAEFPRFSMEKLFSGVFTDSVSKWFSDTEPMRDKFMQLSMMVKEKWGLPKGEDNVTFLAQAGNPEAESGTDGFEETREVGEYVNHLTANEKAKIASRGIFLIGKVPNVRALMAYGGSEQGGVPYAEAANRYKRHFGNSVNVYCMVIPTSAEFYTPANARKLTNPQRPTINNIYAHLDPDVKAVDIYKPLGDHAAEPIYLRTDHHWAPLGGFYAAEAFAKVAGVPFRGLDSYDRRVVHGYVGTMYGYSHDISVKQSPEDFVYYVPRDVDYNTTYITYDVDKSFQVTAEHKPVKGAFFMHYRDGSSGAYCTFMGGDSKITQVRTSTRNGRRVLILKDSFGNALPGYLFYSFEEVHVVDYRYFTKNMDRYVRENGITDILFANNIYKAYESGICRAYEGFLTQDGGISPKPEPAATDRKPGPAAKPEKRKQPETPAPKADAPATPAPDGPHLKAESKK